MNQRTGYFSDRVKRLTREGICTQCLCENKDRRGRAMCGGCSKDHLQRAKVRANDRRQRGACRQCGKEANGRAYCFDHWFNRTSQNHLKDYKRGPELRAIWEAQKGRCALTGLDLTQENAQLDHILPRARGGTNEIANLRWVIGWANLMKRDATDLELMEQCELILHGRSRA